MNWFCKSSLVLAAGLLSGAAALADGPAPAAADPPAVAATPRIADWSGPYLGLQIGRGFGDLSFRSLSDPGDTSGFDIGGNAVGGVVGYNVQRQSLVFGVELAHAETDTHTDGDESREFETFSDLKGRVGYIFGDAFAYGILGYSRSDWRSGSGTTDLDGLAFGIGLEYQFRNQMFLGAEFLVRDYASDPLSGDPDTFLNSSAKTATIRAGFRF